MKKYIFFGLLCSLSIIAMVAGCSEKHANTDKIVLKGVYVYFVDENIVTDVIIDSSTQELMFEKRTIIYGSSFKDSIFSMIAAQEQRDSLSYILYIQIDCLYDSIPDYNPKVTNMGKGVISPKT